MTGEQKWRRRRVAIDITISGLALLAVGIALLRLTLDGDDRRWHRLGLTIIPHDTGVIAIVFPNMDVWKIHRPLIVVFVRPPTDELIYTDDTEMMIGVAECLVTHGRIEADELAKRFCRNFTPTRGYGPGMRKIAEAMNTGQDWRGLVQTVFPGGSLGNGAAMRVAPVGLLFHADLNRVTDEAAASAMVTHVHPIGVDGANILALAVALAVRNEGSFDRREFFTELANRATTEEFEWQLRTAAKQGPTDSISFGSSLEAHRSVTSALLCFANHPDSYTDTVAAAIALGNDTDTLAAMAGARLGINAVPRDWLARVEAGVKYVDQLATELAGKNISV